MLQSFQTVFDLVNAVVKVNAAKLLSGFSVAEINMSLQISCLLLQISVVAVNQQFSKTTLGMRQ